MATIYLKKQSKEIEKGTLSISKILEKDSKVPQYIGTFKAKDLNIARLVIKRFSKISFSELEARI